MSALERVLSGPWRVAAHIICALLVVAFGAVVALEVKGIFEQRALEARRVVVDWRADGWRVEDGHLQFDVWGRKVRDCEFVAGSVAILAQTGSGFTERQVTFLEDTSPGSSRPSFPEHQYFGTWSIPIGGSGGAVVPGLIKGNVLHLCGGDVTASPVGPFTYSLT